MPTLAYTVALFTPALEPRTTELSWLACAPVPKAVLLAPAAFAKAPSASRASGFDNGAFSMVLGSRQTAINPRT